MTADNIYLKSYDIFILLKTCLLASYNPQSGLSICNWHNLRKQTDRQHSFLQSLVLSIYMYRVTGTILESIAFDNPQSGKSICNKKNVRKNRQTDKQTQPPNNPQSGKSMCKRHNLTYRHTDNHSFLQPQSGQYVIGKIIDTHNLLQSFIRKSYRHSNHRQDNQQLKAKLKKIDGHEIHYTSID